MREKNREKRAGFRAGDAVEGVEERRGDQARTSARERGEEDRRMEEDGR